MYLRHGFRRPNFGTKFGASVMGIGPYGEKGKHPQPPGPAAQSGAFAARVRGRGGDCGRDHPQRGHQPRAIPQSRRSRDSSLCTREPWGTGDADCRVALLLAMTVLILCHSEEAQRADVGIRPFLRWTGGRTAVPRAWPPPTKFRAEIWGVGQGRCALRVGAEGPNNHPSQPAHSGAIAAAGAREGWKSARGASPKGIAATSTG